MSGKINIEWITDTHDCETCGYSMAVGAVVTMPNGYKIDMTPFAHCYDDRSYGTVEVYAAIFKQLGYDLEMTETETGTIEDYDTDDEPLEFDPEELRRDGC